VLATVFPDWNSLDSVRRAHSFLEGAALAFFALLVVCEALAHLSDDKKTERRFDKAGIVFFAIAVLAEIMAYPYGQRNDTLSEQMIGSLDTKSKEALANASSALTKSSEAETKADAAETTSGKAVARSSSAMTIASGARKEADSFDVRIVSATNKAAEAESHLADALRQVASAEAEIERIKRPRRLSVAQQKKLGTKLLRFTGQKFAFTVFNDPESFDFLRDLEAVFKNAKWDRVPLPPGLGSGFSFSVPGVSGSVETTNSIGLKVWTASDDRSAGPTIDELASAIVLEGIPCDANFADDLRGKQPAGLIVIAVGKKQP
jgi:hypothetical protein